MSSSRLVQDGYAIQHGGKPEWLESFLQKTFFGSCAIHEPPKNRLNNYCINCNLAACCHCLDAGSHAEHKVLKIYRHVYKDVVPLSEIEKQIDCSTIQAYKCNKQLVIALNPLPHSGSQTSEEAVCDTCKRILYHPNANRYCSIACKVQAFLRKTNMLEPPFLAIQSTSPERKSKRPRKGAPHRAPLA